MFLPTTKEEMLKKGWDKCDVIIVTGDTYIDSPFIGSAVIANLLAAEGYRVGIIAQPDIYSNADITRLGEPDLFWGVTAGSVDSMVANLTPIKRRRRKNDDFTPGGENTRRPDRAAIVYSNLIRQHFKNTEPIVLGGLEASLRRIAHYDYWDDTVRRSILLDAKADFLVYGMGEKTILALAAGIKGKKDVKNTRGLCHISKEVPEGYLNMPSYEEARQDKDKFTEMFRIFYANNDPVTAKGLCQKYDTNYLIQNPPQTHMTQKEIDKVYDLDYERDAHPYYAKLGKVKALETIRFSITSHRGCYGECNFCSIAVHQGKTVISRSEESILKEAEKLSKYSDFKGYILDVGGPTANMYGIECNKKIENGACENKRCLHPVLCKGMYVDHRRQVELLKKLRSIKGVKKVFIASGIRYDMVLYDKKSGNDYMKELVEHHVSGQLKVAPEHTEDRILDIMGKTKNDFLQRFKFMFDDLSRKCHKEQFLAYYLIAAHPGCSEEDMRKMRGFVVKKLHIHPEQVQIFTPLPSTYSALMYYTEVNPFTSEKIFVEKDLNRKDKQKEIITVRSN